MANIPISALGAPGALCPSPFAAVPLGRFERVSIVKCWPGEASHFTPWLAQEENISQLGDAIDVDLEVQHQELAVGEFRADIVCLNTATGRKVLVENQFGRTDHSHLGQLLTYTAGVDAEAIVWVAEQFREEHRAALDWLNRVTTDGINLFGVEIELWRIGSSDPAPRFNVIAKPNEWTDTLKESEGTLSETDALYLQYWTAFGEYASNRKSPFRLPKPSAQTWKAPPQQTNRKTPSLPDADAVTRCKPLQRLSMCPQVHGRQRLGSGEHYWLAGPFPLQPSTIALFCG